MSERPTSWQADAQSDSDLAERLTRLFKRTAEELYDLESDEFEMRNPAGRPEFVALKARLRRELDARIRQQDDEGPATDLKAPSRQKPQRQTPNP